MLQCVFEAHQQHKIHRPSEFVTQFQVNERKKIQERNTKIGALYLQQTWFYRCFSRALPFDRHFKKSKYIKNSIAKHVRTKGEAKNKIVTVLMSNIFAFVTFCSIHCWLCACVWCVCVFFLSSFLNRKCMKKVWFLWSIIPANLGLIFLHIHFLLRRIKLLAFVGFFWQHIDYFFCTIQIKCFLKFKFNALKSICVNRNFTIFEMRQLQQNT